MDKEERKKRDLPIPKNLPLNRENLEKICILCSPIRYNPYVAIQLAKYFDLNMERIREGWLYCSTPKAKEDPEWLLSKIKKLFNK